MSVQLAHPAAFARAIFPHKGCEWKRTAAAGEGAEADRAVSTTAEVASHTIQLPKRLPGPFDNRSQSTICTAVPFERRAPVHFTSQHPSPRPNPGGVDEGTWEADR